MKNVQLTFLALATAVLSLSSCSDGPRSSATGWEYNQSPETEGFKKGREGKNGGFYYTQYAEQEAGPGLVFIEGGRFSMGRVEDDVNYSWDNIQTPVTVSSFYMDETEVTNQHWRDYMRWLRLVYTDDRSLERKALPDTNCWRQKDQDMEKYVEYYLRHPAYSEYPVVGVSWLQASDYCAWRTDRVNEYILVREGILTYNTKDQLGVPFTTETYFNGLYDATTRLAKENDQGMNNLNEPNSSRRVVMEDGILLPRYRLPTEAEWEYAAMALIGNSYQELITDRRTYPWNGHYVRNGSNGTEYFGQMRANFMRGTGDAMGVAGYLNDNADITAPVYQYPPNDFGLYNMAGNVSEWVADVYRPLGEDERSEFRPFRGNVYETKQYDVNGELSSYGGNVYDLQGINEYLIDMERKLKANTNYPLSPDEEALILTCKDLLTLALDAEKAKASLDDVMSMINGSGQVKDGKGGKTKSLVVRLDEATKKKPSEQLAVTIKFKIEEYIVNAPGQIRMRDVSIEENINRTNYRKADNIDYGDGDFQSSRNYQDASYDTYNGYKNGNRDDSHRMYDYGKTTLINNRSRVYKGGSWEDRVYYNIPSTRRFLDERKSSRSIGFRCAMDRVGSPTGLGAKGGME